MRAIGTSFAGQQIVWPSEVCFCYIIDIKFHFTQCQFSLLAL